MNWTRPTPGLSITAEWSIGLSGPEEELPQIYLTPPHGPGKSALATLSVSMFLLVLQEALSPLLLTPLLPPTGRDEASSVEVTWPDGKMVSRSVASGEMNSVLEILYPRDEDKLQGTAPLEVGQDLWASLSQG